MRGMDEKGLRRLVRVVSAAGVLDSFLLVLASLGLAGAGLVHEHAHTMLYAGLLLFPHSVALAYIASAGKGRSLEAVAAASMLSLPLLAAPLLALRWPECPTLLLFVLAAAATAPAALMAAAQRKGTVRLSLTLVSSTYMVSIVTAALWILMGGPGPFSRLALPMTLAYPVLLIYAVSYHSFPRTMGVDPSIPGAMLGYTLSAIAAPASLGGPGLLRVSIALWSAGALIYLWAARILWYPRLLRRLEERPGRASPAYKGMRYFLDGHLYVALVTVLSVAWLAVIALRGCPLRECVLSYIHAAALGFSLMHVAIHAPMMLPVIVGVRHAMRYTSLPYVLVLLSTAAWPLSGEASLVLAVLAVIAMLYVFVPLGSAGRGSRGK